MLTGSKKKKEQTDPQDPFKEMVQEDLREFCSGTLLTTIKGKTRCRGKVRYEKLTIPFKKKKKRGTLRENTEKKRVST